MLLAHDVGRQRATGFANLCFRADRGIGKGRGERREARRQGQPQGAVGCEPDHALAPALGGLVELAHRQGVEEFIGDQQERARRHVVEAFVPGRREAGQGGALCPPERTAGVDEMQVECGVEARHGTGRAQRVGHQRAAAGSEFDQPHGRGRAHRPPALRQPCAQEFAEHLGDFRRRREVAPGTQGHGTAIVAEAGMAQRLGHEAGDRDRSGERDAVRDQTAEFAGHGSAGLV